MTEGAAQAWNGIKSVFSTVADFFGSIFSSAWQRVKDVFSVGGQIFDGIKDGIVSAFKNIVNAIIRGINKVIALPFNKINDVLNGIKDISILGIKPFSGMWGYNPLSVPEIPQFETGGFPEDGLFFANHTELVGQFSNGQTAVANNAQITEGIANAVYPAVYNAVMAAMSNTNGQNGDVVVQIDGKEVFRSTQKYASQYLAMTGQPAFEF